MTIDEKVGQMLMPDFRNWQKQGEAKATGFIEMNSEVASIIKKYHLGGVILFAENVVETEQTVRLTDGLQMASKDIPLFITIDQEGGIVTRLQTGTNLMVIWHLVQPEMRVTLINLEKSLARNCRHLA